MSIQNTINVSNGYLSKVLSNIPKHAVFVSQRLDDCSVGTFDHRLEKLSCPEFSHIVNHTYLEPIPIQVIIFWALYLNHQNQRVVNHVVFAEVVKCGLQMFKDVFFAKDRLAESINQKVDI